MLAVQKTALSGTTLVTQRRCRNISGAIEYSKITAFLCAWCRTVPYDVRVSETKQRMEEDEEDWRQHHWDPCSSKHSTERVKYVVFSTEVNWSCGYRVD